MIFLRIMASKLYPVILSSTNRYLLVLLLFMSTSSFAQQIDIKNSFIEGKYKLPNNIAPLDYEDELIYRTDASKYCPVKDEAFIEHIRTPLTKEEEKKISAFFHSKSADLKNSKYLKLIQEPVTAIQKNGSKIWIGSKNGLYIFDENSKKISRHNSYGINGPLSTEITDIVLDSKRNLWIGTPLGLSVLNTKGDWTNYRGTEGLPVEEITALNIDKNDNIWIGTNQGVILFKPYENGRQWFYRAGKRYLINDIILDIKISENRNSVYFKTPEGISKLDINNRTLAQKAEIIEGRIDTWHRRSGLVAASILNDAENPTSKTIKDNDNDGLWTSYHVVAMSLAYATTGNKKYLKSAKKSMDAMIMLQNISGIPGLVARSVVPVSQRAEMSKQWRESPDGKFLWKSDTSSDEIDGHFFAFYAYWEHIAKNDPEEAKLIKKQIWTLMNYIVDHNYQLIDWDGKRTKWGFWNPELINDNPENYSENGLNSAQILSFLKVSYYITGDQKFKKHYDHLITEHGYLANVLLEKKLFPDLNNHSDNQLAFVALYPLLQLEYDSVARNALQRTVRRHYRILSRDGSAFFYFAAATIDPDYVDIMGGVNNIREIPTDRRQWKMTNSNRKDIIWSPYKSRFGKKQLIHVLPADERNFDRWNRNPYYPDAGKGGIYEDDGASWLLAYWMGRYHGFIKGY